MKQYQNWLAQYMKHRRDGNHVMAAELAANICKFWQARGEGVEYAKWQKVYQGHLQQAT